MSRGLTIAVTCLLALVGLFGQLSAISHALITAHSICEHGEVIHADGDAPPAAVATSSAATLGDLPEAEHEHGCGLLSGLSHSVAGPDPGCFTLAPPPESLAAAELPTSAPFHDDRLRFAPKTSPPGSTTHA